MDLWGIITDAMTGGLMDDIYNMMRDYQEASSDYIRSIFFIEDSTSIVALGTLSTRTVDDALGICYQFMIGLLVLKLIWQGYKVYVLWKDGEAEVSPTNMLTNSIYAVCVALAFPVLYKIGYEIAMSISRGVAREFPFSLMLEETIILADMPDLIKRSVSSMGQNLSAVVLAATYSIVSIILYFKMLGRGVQMLLYRLGVPLAVVGLVNNDGGIWKDYIHIYFQQLAIAMIQDFCIRMSLVLLASASGTAFSFGKTIFALVFLFSAFSTPKIFNSILQSNNGSGRGTQIFYTVMMAARSFK